MAISPDSYLIQSATLEPKNDFSHSWGKECRLTGSAAVAWRGEGEMRTY